MFPNLKLTGARRRGLEVLARRGIGTRVDPDGNGLTRISNVTDPRKGFIYWQTGNWLLEEELVERWPDTWSDYVRLTGRGEQLLEELGLVEEVPA